MSDFTKSQPSTDKSTFMFDYQPFTFYPTAGQTCKLVFTHPVYNIDECKIMKLQLMLLKFFIHASLTLHAKVM